MLQTNENIGRIDAASIQLETTLGEQFRTLLVIAKVVAYAVPSRTASGRNRRFQKKACNEFIRFAQSTSSSLVVTFVSGALNGSANHTSARYGWGDSRNLRSSTAGAALQQTGSFRRQQLRWWKSLRLHKRIDLGRSVRQANVPSQTTSQQPEVDRTMRGGEPRHVPERHHSHPASCTTWENRLTSTFLTGLPILTHSNVLDAGINDLLFGGSPQGIIGNLIRHVRRLSKAGAIHFLLPNLTPGRAGDPRNVATQEVNELLANELMPWALHNQIDLTLVDWWSTIDAALQEPSRFWFSQRPRRVVEFGWRCRGRVSLVRRIRPLYNRWA